MPTRTLTRSVYGDDRKVVLLERGTQPVIPAQNAASRSGSELSRGSAPIGPVSR
jgi:hypothetical protein